ncbi:sesquiterpene synthase 12-like [Nicotiana tabacum]|uniref:Sesquiterpene synthase 12-like n=3 Tax=Nicotiana TaxID=4085 RepID=A0AC58TMV4_TOBAC|nr:germacrene C synthase-like [Nicotiana sylvestris]ADI87446.1 cembratrienol synthase 2a [Nicotiana sylvestris]
MSQSISPLICSHFAKFQSNIWRCNTSQLRVIHSSYASFGGRRKERVRRMNRAMDLSSSSRHLADFPSTIWGDHFLSYNSEITEITTQEKNEHEMLKEIVRKMLVETPDNSTQKLVLIDTIQRLGLAYHFNDEIENSIQNIFNLSQNSEDDDEHNLYVAALRFRLARQQGYYMSSDVFKQFTNHDGKFKENHTNDVQGLLSLYEAAHMRVHDEEILEEALIFTTTHLESVIPNLSNSLKVQVTEALSHPIRKAIPRVGARKYIHIYENIGTHNDLLLKFAKLDFNMLQKLHRKELNELTSWWKDLDRANKFPYAKDRLVEAYFWTVGIYFEPQYSRSRSLVTKVVKMNSIIDDTYDAYATFDELVLFTDAIQRWDEGAMDLLPTYLRPIYQGLLDVFNEMEEVLAKEGKADHIYYAKKEMKKVAEVYFKEAEWLNANYIPKCEEYMKNGLVSSTGPMYGIISLVVMEEIITKEAFEWLTNEPLILRAASTICRLMDDMADHEVEQQRGHVASFVECYMKEYGVSKQEAYVEMRKKITNAWKDINKELLRPTAVPMFILERSLNFSRLADTFLKDDDGYTNPKSKVKDLIASLFVESVDI